jgi:hypothetical protein
VVAQNQRPCRQIVYQAVRHTHQQNTVSLPNFKIEQSNKIDITANSGLFLLAELIKKIDLLEKLARLNIFQRQKIGEAVHTLTLVLNQ